MTPPLAATIVIATRNRALLLQRAIESCMAQEGVDFEVLVYDDASTDQTSTFVRERFPDVRLFTNQEQHGYIHSRNRGFRDARSPIVVSLDDDAMFSSPNTLSELLTTFDTAQAIAAVALPYVEPRNPSNRTMSRRLSPGTQVRNYIGCAHAIRKTVALELGGYVEELVHQGEERDLCIRLLDNGYRVVYGNSAPIVHLYSPSRDRARVNYFGYRNTLLFNWMRVPFPHWFARNIVNTLQLLAYRFDIVTLGVRVRALVAGWWGITCFRKLRQPVRRSTYRHFRELPGHGPMRLEQLDPAERRLVDEVMTSLSAQDSQALSGSRG